MSEEKHWRPNKRQEEFLALPDDIFEALYGGAAGGGKSEMLLMLPFARQFYLNPQFKGIIFRRTFPELEGSLILRTKTGIGRSGPSYYDFGGSYNDQKHVWTFPNPLDKSRPGATIRFSYMESNDDARSHKTAEYNYIGFDELTQFDEFQYVFLTSRCRSSDPNLPAIIRSASNPEGIGLAWVRDRFVSPAPEGSKRIFDRFSSSSRIFVPARLTDNPDLMESDPSYMTRLNLLPEALRKAMIQGDWFTFSGQVFTEFRTELIPGEPSNAVHVIPPFDIPAWWPKILSIDWGFKHYLSAHWGAVTPEKRVIIYREYMSKGEYNSTWASNIRKLSQFDENIHAVVLGRDAWNNRGDQKTTADQFHDFSGFRPEQADTDRIGGKLLLHEFLRWKRKPEGYKPSEGYSETKSQEILRRYGLEAVKEYKKLFIPEPEETNLPRLQIFNTCKGLIRCIPLLVYNEDSNDPMKAEDVAKMDGDDAYDSLRYLLKGVDRYVLRVQREAIDRQKLSKIIETLHNTGDMTDFYMRMDGYDRTKDKNTSVSRYRRFN